MRKYKNSVKKNHVRRAGECCSSLKYIKKTETTCVPFKLQFTQVCPMVFSTYNRRES